MMKAVFFPVGSFRLIWSRAFVCEILSLLSGGGFPPCLAGMGVDVSDMSSVQKHNLLV